MNRAVKKTTDDTPARSTASTTASAAARSSANGLSSSRCRPAARPVMARPAWTSGGSATATASTAAISCVGIVGNGRVPRICASGGGLGRVAAPHADQLDIRMRGQRRALGVRRPMPRAEQPKPHWRRCPALLHVPSRPNAWA